MVLETWLFFFLGEGEHDLTSERHDHLKWALVPIHLDMHKTDQKIEGI